MNEWEKYCEKRATENHSVICIEDEEVLRLFNIWGEQHNYNPEVRIESYVKPYFPYKKVTRVIQCQ